LRALVEFRLFDKVSLKEKVEHKEKWYAHTGCMEDNRIIKLVTRYKPHRRRLGKLGK
jgi:hypothetical protein